MKFSKTHTKSSIFMMGKKENTSEFSILRKNPPNYVNGAMDIYVLLCIQHTPHPLLLRMWKWYLLTCQLDLPWSNILSVREIFI